MFENDHNENGIENTQFDSQPINEELSVSGVDNVTKKGRGRKAALIGGISAAVVVGGSTAAYAASDTVKNQVKLRMSSPENYYAWVTENNSKDLGQMLSENYKKSIDNMEKGADAKFKLSFEPTQDAKDMLMKEIFDGSSNDETKQFEDIIKNNDSIGIAADWSVKKGKTNCGLGLELSDKRVVGAEAAIDADVMDYFVRIPELKEQWIGVSMGETMDELMSDEEANDIFNTYKEIMNDPASFLSPDELETEVNRYAGVWGSFADDVKLEKKESVDICDIKADYTVATVELNEKDVTKLGVEFLKEIKSDDIIKGIVVDKVKAVDSEDEFKDSINDAIDELKEQLDEDDFDEDTVFTIDTYIDATGTIRGFGFEAEEEKLTMILGKDGKDVRGEMKFVSDGEEEFSVKLKAEEEGKDKYTGDVTIAYPHYSYDYDDDGNFNSNTSMEEAVIKFDSFEIVDKEKGYFNGDFVINIPDVDPIDITFSSDGKQQEVGYELRIEGKDYGKLKLAYSVDYGTSVDVPSKDSAFMVDVKDADNFKLEEYASQDEFSKFAKGVMTEIGIDDKTADELAKYAAEELYDSVDSGLDIEDDDFDWDDEDFDLDLDEDEDDDRQPTTSAFDDDEFEDFDYEKYMAEFDWDSLKYEDYKDFMTEEQFKEMVEEAKKYADEYSSKAGSKTEATTKKAS
ncbi:DUF6583 family protein [Ruminococcus sp.]|uniref:DUF6583 family protein n=1 Tax=Ruminococcus sp. TaxID=41978 RepID=UPI0025DF160C|nr:DUF6583 family protein [Ruminococcus sp.]MCR4638911.1 hypothetical protein [Ruminococcus sp.]